MPATILFGGRSDTSFRTPGIGESIRGNALDFVDSATGTERDHHGLSTAEHDATIRGREETSVGISNMEGDHRAQTSVPVDKPGGEVGTGNTVRGEAPGGSAVGLGTGRAGAV